MADQQAPPQPDFWSQLGQGLRGAGAVLSPQVYESQAHESREALVNVSRSLEIKKAQRALDADRKFSEALGGMQPSAFKTSSDLMDALKTVPLDVIAESPRAQAVMGMAGQMQQRESMQEQRRQGLEFKYAQLQQQSDIAGQRAEDARLSAVERARANLAREQMQGQILDLKRQIAGFTPGGGAAPKRDYKAEYDKLDPAGRTALDAQAWNWITTKNLPYRKGTGGGADRNDPVIHRAGEIANELGMSAQELSGKSAEFKADAQSLAVQTKKLNAIQGTLESFHNNIATWESIADGEAPKLGGAKLAEMRDKLKRIDFSDVKTVNDWEIKIRNQFNDPSMVAYTTAAMTVAMDYSRLLSSQGQSAAAVTEGARNEAMKLIAAGYNRDARKALIGTLESDAAGQVRGLETQTNRLRKKMGLRDAPSSSPETPKPAAKQASAADIEQSAKTAWGAYEPDKYQYRVNPETGKLQRAPKGG